MVTLNQKKERLKSGGTRFVNPYDQAETVFIRDKNGRLKFVNPEFVVDTADDFARFGLPEASFPSITNRVTSASNRAEANIVDEVYPKPRHGAPITTTASRFDAIGEGVVRPLDIGERARFDHRQKMRKKYNSPKRRSYLTYEDRTNTANMQRRLHTVGRHRGSVAEYKAKVAEYIRQLETELSYLDAGSKKQVRRAIIEDTLADLRKEMRKTADQINPSKTGLPHKLELKIIAALKEEGQPLSHLSKTIEAAGKDISTVRNKSILSEIQKLRNVDFQAVQKDGKFVGSYVESSPIRASMLRSDLMQENLSENFLKRHLRDFDFMANYMNGVYIPPKDGAATVTKVGINYKSESGERVSRIKVGKSVLNERAEAAARQRDAEKYVKRMEQAVSRNNARKESRAASQAARVDPSTGIKISPDYIARYKATISSEQQASRVATRSTGRMTSSIAEQLGQDTLRAASVIHSSKMNYAAVGAAGLAAVFGITSLGRQRRNAEEEIKTRV